MIRTGYFAKIDTYIKKGFTPISISRWSPRWLHIPEWKTVAPPERLLLNSKQHIITQDDYARVYRNNLENNRDVILSEFEEFKDRDCILLCYEGPGAFCHRHLLAKWLNQQYQDDLVTEFNV